MRLVKQLRSSSHCMCVEVSELEVSGLGVHSVRNSVTCGMAFCTTNAPGRSAPVRIILRARCALRG